MSIDDKGSMTGVLRSFLPWFAKAPVAGRIVRPIEKSFDKMLQGAIDAVRLRYPSVCPPDALALLGADRRIPRARNESIEAYRRRLLLWLDYWAHAGLPLGLLYAIQSYVYPGFPTVRIVTRSGYWYTLDEGASATQTPYEVATLPCAPEPGFDSNPLRYAPAPETMPRAPFWNHVADLVNWDYDSNSNPERAANWWDFWLIIYPPSYEFQGEYDGDVFYDTDTCWGLDVDPGTMATLRLLLATYKRAGAECRGILFPPTKEDFDPYALISDPGMPDGWWGQDVRLVAGEWVGTRREDVRYDFP